MNGTKFRNSEWKSISGICLRTGRDDDLVLSAEGVMGEAWAVLLPNARSTQIVTGDFCFLAGAPDGGVVGNIPASFSSEYSYGFQDEGWGKGT